MLCARFLASPNPRTADCARCGLPRDRHEPDRHERDFGLEQRLTLLAAQAGGLTDDRGLRAFADHRAWPGGVRIDLDPDIEAAEELADCASYLVWGMIAVYPGYLAGESASMARFERRMRALVRVVQAWHELHTEAH